MAEIDYKALYEACGEVIRVQNKTIDTLIACIDTLRLQLREVPTAPDMEKYTPSKEILEILTGRIDRVIERLDMLESSLRKMENLAENLKERINKLETSHLETKAQIREMIMSDITR